MMDDIDSFVSKQLQRFEHVTVYRDQLEHAKETTNKHIGRFNSWLKHVLGDIYFLYKYLFFPFAILFVCMLIYGLIALYRNKNILKFVVCTFLFLVICFTSTRYKFIVF